MRSGPCQAALWSHHATMACSKSDTLTVPILLLLPCFIVPVQLDAKVPEANSTNICAALRSLRQLGAKPTPLMANALVIKTQQQLAAAPTAQTGAVTDGGQGQQAVGSTRAAVGTGASPVLPGGLAAADLAAAVWALASAGLRLPPTWCTTAVKQLAAVAADLALPAMLHTLYAAISWHINPLPKPLLASVQRSLDAQQQQLEQLLPAEQLGVIASGLLSAGQAVPEALTPYLPAGAAKAVAVAGALTGGQSFAERAAGARLAEAVWQEARRVLKDGGSLDAGIVQAAAAGLKEQPQAALASYLKPVSKWADVLQALAQHQVQVQQQQQQQSEGGHASQVGGDLLALPDVSEWLQAVTAAVQQAAATAQSSNGGPTVLVALAVLRADVQPAWLAALTADLDSQAGSKSSWFKQAGVQQVLWYLQGLSAAGREVSLSQLEGLAKHMPSRLHTLSAQDLLALLQLLPAAQVHAEAQPQQVQQVRRQQQCTDELVAATLPVLLAAMESGQLQQSQAQLLVAGLARLGCTSLMTGSSSSSSSSNSSNTGAKKRASGGNSSSQPLTAEQALQLLQLSLSSPDSSNSISSGGVFFLLGCMQLATLAVPADMRLPQLCQQLLQLFVHEVSQQEELHPHTAAQLFIPAVAVAVTLTPDIARGLARPDAQLGGCLTQLLADVEAGWQQVGSAELAAMPRMVANIHLALMQPEDFINAVLKRQQGLAQLSKVLPSAVQEAAAAGAGPVQLLHAAVFQVMNKQVAEPGNSTWEGLRDFVSTDGSSSSSGQAGAGHDGGAGAGQLMIPAALFQATNEAVARIAGSLTAGEMCDLLHCFWMADQGSASCSWVQDATQKLMHVKEAAKLSPNQQQALLVLYTMQLQSSTESQSADWPLVGASDGLQATFSTCLGCHILRSCMFVFLMWATYASWVSLPVCSALCLPVYGV